MTHRRGPVRRPRGALFAVILASLAMVLLLGAAVTIAPTGREDTRAADGASGPSTTSAAPPAIDPLPYGLSGDVSAYGPRGDLPARRGVSGSMKITERGTVIADLTIKGSLTVAADNVTIRNVAFVAPAKWKWQQRPNFVTIRPRAKGTIIEDSTFDGSNREGVPVVYDAVSASKDVTLQRCEVTKVANAIEFASGTVESCFIHDIWQAGPESEWHADGIQSDQGSGIVVRNNYIRMGRPPTGYWAQTSAIGMWADLSSSSVLEDVLVEHNVIEPFGGFAFYAGITNGVAGARVSNVVFSENVVIRAGALPADYGVWYQHPENPIHGTRIGNVYDDGSPIPPDA